MPTSPTPKLFVLTIALEDLKPKVWRRIEVPGELTLADLHEIIQCAMGWTDSHMHIFKQGSVYYCMAEDDSLDWADPGKKSTYLDETKVCLGDVFKKKGQKLSYEYDFGDDWRHTLVLEEIREFDPATDRVTCVDGAGACPPEDCGGVYGYKQILEALEHPEGDDAEDLLDLVGEDFDSKDFEVKTANKALAKAFPIRKAKAVTKTPAKPKDQESKAKPKASKAKRARRPG